MEYRCFKFRPNLGWTWAGMFPYLLICLAHRILSEPICPPGDATVGLKTFYYGTEEVYFKYGREACEAAPAQRVSSFENREEFDAIQAAAPRVWAGINGNRVECVEVGCNGITVWWYDNVTPFTSGAIPDKLTMTERIPPVKVLRRCAYSEGGEVLGDIHCGAEVKAIMVCECVEDPTTTTTTTTTTFTITTTITSTTTTTSSSSTTTTTPTTTTTSSSSSSSSTTTTTTTTTGI